MRNLDDLSSNKEMSNRRCELIEKVADFDSELASSIIERESIESITTDELRLALKRVTIGDKAVPVLIGSSYKNIGVQPLLDSILMYVSRLGTVHNEASVKSGEGGLRDPVTKHG